MIAQLGNIQLNAGQRKQLGVVFHYAVRIGKQQGQLAAAHLGLGRIVERTREIGIIQGLRAQDGHLRLFAVRRAGKVAGGRGREQEL